MSHKDQGRISEESSDTTESTTIVRTIARESIATTVWGKFLFSRGDGDVSHAGKFFTSIAVQLANWSLSLKCYICNAISEQHDIAGRSLRDQ